MHNYQSLLAAGLMLLPLALQAAEPLPYYNPGEDISSVTTQGQGSKKWSVYTYANDNGFRIAPVNKSTQCEAWLWTPELEIEAGKIYEVSVSSRVSRAQGTTSFEAYTCAEPTSTSAHTLIFKGSGLTTSKKFFSAYVEADASTGRYIGFKNTCLGNHDMFWLDDIKVREINPESPTPPTSLTATAEGKTISISLNAPTKTVFDKDLTPLAYVKLYRNGLAVHEWSNPSLGQQLTFTDDVPLIGEYTYTAVAAVESGEGDPAATTVIAGGSTKLDPTTWGPWDRENCNNPKATTTYNPATGIEIAWSPYDAGEGVEVTYTVTRISNGKIIADHVAATSATDPDGTLSNQALFTYTVTAHYDNTDKELYTSATASIHNGLPFITCFDLYSINEFTSIDLPTIQSNGELGPDGNKWGVQTAVQPKYHPGIERAFSVNCANDWLITPGLDMKAGKTYRIDVDAFSNNIIPKNYTFEIKLGKQNTAEAMETHLAGPFTNNDMLAQRYSAFVTPTADEHNFIGIYSYNAEKKTSYDSFGISGFTVKEVPGGLPTGVTDIKVTFSTTDPTKATLSLKAPTTDVTGKALTALTKIEILKDGTLFKTFDNPQPAEELSTEITVQLGAMSVYTMVPYTADGEGLSERTEVFIIEPPYENDFNDKGTLTGFTIINPDATGYTWSIQANAARAYPSSEYGHDDYLVTPPIHLEAGQFYKLSFTTWCGRLQGNSDNRLEVLLGTSPTIEGLTTTIIAPYTVTSAGVSQAVLLKEYFTVPVTGEYYLAWHAMSPAAGASELYVDNLTLSDKIDPTVPNMATDLVISPDPEGELKGTLSFTLPVIDLAGDPLTYTVYRYEVYRDGSMISSGFPKEGETSYTINDQNMAEGMHLYSVICYKANKVPGREKEDVAWFGHNLPAAVPFVSAEETPGKYGEVTITWDAPETDINGFALNTSNITYTVGQLKTSIYNGEVYEKVFETGYTGKSLTVNVATVNDKQEFCRFFVRPATPKGEARSTMITKYIAIGPPYTMPLRESFADYMPTISVIQMGAGDGTPTSWGFNSMNPVTGVEPVDGDNGLAMMEVMFSGGGSRLVTGKVSVTGEKPTLYMWIYNQTKGERIDNNTLAIETREGNGDFEQVASHNINEWAEGRPGWQKAAIDMSAAKGKDVYLSFNGTAGRFTFIHLDNLSLEEEREHDLGVVAIDMPDVLLGIDHTLRAHVRNNGSTEATYSATLSLDGLEIDRKDGLTLAPGTTAAVEFTNCLTREHIGKHVYTVTAVYDPDTDLLDNEKQTAEFAVDDNTFPTVENLGAEQQGQAVTLTWEEPILPDAPQAVTDDFMSYPAWSTMHTGIGQWTLVDVDEGNVGGFQNWEMPNIAIGSQQSFYIMDFADEHFATDFKYRAHSGTQCLVSSYNTNGLYTNDVLISPLLAGTAQTISFWAKALRDEDPENFIVRYSTTTSELGAFTETLASEKVGGTWTRFTYELPAGARYFEIVHYNYGSYFLFIDDITYTPRGDESLVLNGYNVYRGYDKVNRTPLATTTWADAAPAEGTNAYSVSAVYDRGESPAVEISASWSSLDAIGSDTITVSAEGTDIVITGARGSEVVVCNVAGMIMTAFDGTGHDRVTVTPGVYIVTTAAGTTKINVR